MAREECIVRVRLTGTVSEYCHYISLFKMKPYMNDCRECGRKKMRRSTYAFLFKKYLERSHSNPGHCRQQACVDLPVAHRARVPFLYVLKLAHCRVCHFDFGAKKAFSKNTCRLLPVCLRSVAWLDRVVVAAIGGRHLLLPKRVILLLLAQRRVAVEVVRPCAKV